MPSLPSYLYDRLDDNLLSRLSCTQAFEHLAHKRWGRTSHQKTHFHWKYNLTARTAISKDKWDRRSSVQREDSHLKGTISLIFVKGPNTRYCKSKVFLNFILCEINREVASYVCIPWATDRAMIYDHGVNSLKVLLLMIDYWWSIDLHILRLG